MASRKQCIKDILLETDGTPNKGWQTPPDIPNVQLEDRVNTFEVWFKQADRLTTILIKKDIEFDREKLGDDQENRVYTSKIAIITNKADNLQLYFDQACETFNRYNKAPFATDTNSITYNEVTIDKGKEDHRRNRFVMDCIVQLIEEFQDIVIA